MDNEKKNNVIKHILETGSEISGGIGGAIIGGLVPGPDGVMIGGISGPVITKAFKMIGTEITQRLLGPREEVRVGAAYVFAFKKVQENETKGLTLRNDDFFDPKEHERPASEEILEGVILAAQREYEEQKIRFLGNLYANICTNSEVSKEHANQLIKTADTTSFRQFCILQLLNEKLIESQQLNFKIRGFEKWEVTHFDIVAEMRDLQVKGLVNIPSTFDGGDNSSPIQLNKLTITPGGRFFCKMLALEEIEQEKLKKINDLTAIKKD